jgi:hypothetical protein
MRACPIHENAALRAECGPICVIDKVKCTSVQFINADDIDATGVPNKAWLAKAKIAEDVAETEYGGDRTRGPDSKKFFGLQAASLFSKKNCLPCLTSAAPSGLGLRGGRG